MHKTRKFQFGGSSLGLSSNLFKLNDVTVTGMNLSKSALLNAPTISAPTSIPKTNNFTTKLFSSGLNKDITSPKPNLLKSTLNNLSPSKGIKLSDDILGQLSNGSLGGNLASSGLNILNSLSDTVGAKTPSLVNSIGETTSGVIGQINPLAGAANSAGNLLAGSIFGKRANPDDTGGQIINQVSNVASMFGPIGMGVGAAMKLGVGAMTSKIKGNTMDDRTAASTGYMGTLDKNQKTSYRMFGKSKQRGKVRAQQEKLGQISGILKDSENAKLASENYTPSNQSINYTTGIRFGRHGLTMPTKQDVISIQIILNSDKQEEVEEQLEDTCNMNIIPDGKLHAHNHNLSEIDDKFKNVSKKGIPVILDDGNEVIQAAEIEKEEIIFTLELTEKLEELRKDGSEEAMILAGKILAKEIMENTIDYTNKLINNEDSKD